MNEPYQFDVDEWWRLDRVGIAPSEQYTVREAEAVRKVSRRVVKKPEGYQVSLPFGSDARPDTNYKNAIAQLESLQTKFRKDREYFDQYQGVIDKCIEAGFISEVKEPKVEGYYMPHFGIRKDSRTTPLRIVFNASAKSKGGAGMPLEEWASNHLAFGSEKEWREPVSVNVLRLRWTRDIDRFSKAYGAVAYTRDDCNQVNLITSKMRITPKGMNKLKIPKLELLALLLGSRLAKTLKELIEPQEVVIWTDSKVTLAWVASPEAKDHKNVFISNRVAEIVFLQQVCQLSSMHVPSKQNPADILSRGATTQQLLDNSLWRNGPEFFRTTGKPFPGNEEDPTQEKRTVAAVQELREEMNPSPPGEIWEILQREVDFQFLLRVVEAFQPLMRQPPPPPLPKERITLTKPFTAVGVDHTTAIQTETRPGYILIVTCMATRAVYFDFCPSLEAEEFVLALRRFSATHGAPQLMMSDNHQTFKTSSHLLQGLYEEDEVHQFLRKTGIKWRFQTPRAPWKVGGDKCEDEVLTPSHLLRGHQVNLMAPILPDDHLNATFTSRRLRDRYLKLRDSLKAFRERWRREYLSALRARHDCRSGEPSKLHPGDVVLVKQENQKRATWPLGRVVETYPDDDGVVRSAKVLFEGVESLRAVSHLVPLEIAPSKDDDGEQDDDDGDDGEGRK
ncbi:uncharacterized protein [Palaemon carinicauda]|uniref:uncharacterized protein n=1 Tax=Palaemon carinicauda TaxID=392227 RepID=UPI0035B638DE